MGVQSATVEQRKTVFRIIVSVIETYFHEKRFMNGLVNNIKRVTQESFKKVYFRKKIVQENHFYEMFFWMILKSVRVQRSKNRKKIIFRACFPFSTQNHIQNYQIFESFGIIYQRLQRNDKSILTLCFRKSIFYEKFFREKIFWATKLSVRVQRTDDTKEKIRFGENFFFHWFVSFKRIEWFGKIRQWVYTRMMIKIIKVRKKYKIGVFSKKSFEKHCYQWEYRVPLLKKEKKFSEFFLISYRELISWKTFFEWFGKT